MNCLGAFPELLFVASTPLSLLLVAGATILQQANLALATGAGIAALRHSEPVFCKNLQFLITSSKSL